MVTVKSSEWHGKCSAGISLQNKGWELCVSYLVDSELIGCIRLRGCKRSYSSFVVGEKRNRRTENSAAVRVLS